MGYKSCMRTSLRKMSLRGKMRSAKCCFEVRIKTSIRVESVAAALAQVTGLQSTPILELSLQGLAGQVLNMIRPLWRQ